MYKKIYINFDYTDDDFKNQFIYNKEQSKIFRA